MRSSRSEKLLALKRMEPVGDISVFSTGPQTLVIFLVELLLLGQGLVQLTLLFCNQENCTAG